MAYAMKPLSCALCAYGAVKWQAISNAGRLFRDAIRKPLANKISA